LKLVEEHDGTKVANAFETADFKSGFIHLKPHAVTVQEASPDVRIIVVASGVVQVQMNGKQGVMVADSQGVIPPMVEATFTNISTTLARIHWFTHSRE
jgi:glyoxylate utilization-related uncharacterized protein